MSSLARKHACYGFLQASLLAEEDPGAIRSSRCFWPIYRGFSDREFLSRRLLDWWRESNSAIE